MDLAIRADAGFLESLMSLPRCSERNPGKECLPPISLWPCLRAVALSLLANAPCRVPAGILPEARSGKRRGQSPHPWDRGDLDRAVPRRDLLPNGNECYCEDVFFFIGQAADEEGQQQAFVALHFFVIGQFFCEPWLEAHPVNPIVAMQATVRRVTSDFISDPL